MTWTPDRPTKPGKYWLSLHPRERGNLRASFPVEIDSEDNVFCAGGVLRDDAMVGAQWLPFEPADPFAEPVPSLRSRIEALPRLDPYPDNEHAWFASMKATPDGDYLDRSEVLALLDEVTR